MEIFKNKVNKVKSTRTIKTSGKQIIFNRVLFPSFLNKIEIIYEVFDENIKNTAIIKMDNEDIEKLKDFTDQTDLDRRVEFKYILNKISCKQEIPLNEVSAFLNGVSKLTGHSKISSLYNKDISELSEYIQIIKSKRNNLSAKNSKDNHQCDYCKADRSQF